MESESQQPATNHFPRPTSITVISWILIVLGILACFSTLSALKDANIRHTMEQQAAARGQSPALFFILTFVGIAIGPVTGIGILRRHGWVRFLYVIWTMAMIILILVTQPQNIGAMIPSFIIFIIVSIFIFRPAANRYFSSKPKDNEQHPA